jgi:thioredoxin-like negative regulator of GroEL
MVNRTVQLFLFLSLILAPAVAQDGDGDGDGGGGRRRGRRGNNNPPPSGTPSNPDPDPDPDPPKDPPKDHKDLPKVNWVPKFADAQKELDESKSRKLMIFVHQPSNPMEPSGFYSPDVVKKLEEGWTCVKVPYSRDSAELKPYQIKGIPVVILADRHGNEFASIPGMPSPEVLRPQLEKAAKEIEAFARKLAEDLQTGITHLASGRTIDALKVFGSIAAGGRRGYSEIAEAAAKARSALPSIEANLKDPSKEVQGVKELTAMVESFKGTDLSRDAKLRLAEFFASKGELAAAFKWLKQISAEEPKDHPVAARASDLNRRLVDAGYTRIRAALAEGREKGIGWTRDAVEKIQQEYKDTEVAKQAGDVMRDLKR